MKEEGKWLKARREELRKEEEEMMERYKEGLKKIYKFRKFVDKTDFEKYFKGVVIKEEELERFKDVLRGRKKA